MNLASMACICDSMLFGSSGPRHIDEEFAIVLAELHSADAVAARVVDLLSNFTIVPAVDDASGIGEEVKNI